MPVSRRVLFALIGVNIGCGASESMGPPLTRDLLTLERSELVAAVNPFVGTGGVGFATGSTYPGPAVPHGMIHLGPDTSSSGSALPSLHCSGYRYEDASIDGFSLLRMNGTGVPDYGTIALMPVDGMSVARRSADGYRSTYDHAGEHAEPGYYRVLLDTGVTVEITTAARAGMFRFTFPDGAEPTVLLDLEHAIGGGESLGGAANVDREQVWIGGWMHNLGTFSDRIGGFPVFTRVTFDVAPEELGVWNEAGLSTTESSVEGVDIGAWARFPTGTKTVEVKVGVSFVDESGAATNLDAELGGVDFDAVREAAAALWQAELSKLEIFNASSTQATKVATALYHALLMPTLMSDADGRMRDTSAAITTTSSPRYSDFSLWDTYRTLHPWLMLAEHPAQTDFVASLVAFGESGGAVPRWSLAHGDVRSMIGSPGEIVLAESAAKRVDFEDEESAYGFARLTAFGPAPGSVGGRSGIDDYLALGFVAADHMGGSASRTMEYAIADHAVAGWAERLGRTDDANTLALRATSYRTLFDPELGFFRGKNSDGSFDDWPGELAEADHYTEGNAWQYLWLAPHEPDGLADTLGGRDVALERLRTFFERSVEETPVLGHRQYYWHGNEPGLHVPWLFAMWGAREETAKWVRWVSETSYGTDHEGLAGNDDSGTVSAWLLFASAGLYPLAGSDRYVVGVPMFPRVVLHRASGDLTIEADAEPATHPIVVGVTLDGTPVEGPYLVHEQLRGDHTLAFSLAR